MPSERRAMPFTTHSFAYNVIREPCPTLNLIDPGGFLGTRLHTDPEARMTLKLLCLESEILER